MPSALSRRAPRRALYIFLGCNLLAGLSPTLQAAEPTELLDLCRPDSLPQDIRSSLSRNFSGWKIQEPTDLSTRARTRWGAERPLWTHDEQGRMGKSQAVWPPAGVRRSCRESLLGRRLVIQSLNDDGGH